MSSEDNNNTGPRRTSFGSTTFSSLLGRSSTTGISPFPGPITTAAAQDQRRRMSVSGTSPTQTSLFARRISVSTNNSDAIPENAIDDDEEAAQSGPAVRARRMSRAAEDVLSGSSALRKNLGSPNSNGEGFNWSEQIRSRAESSVSSAGRPSFGSSSADKSPPSAAIHERAKSVSELAKPQVQPQTLKERIYAKPDEIGERMLKGDYYY